ncbi:MAG: preprotein translocase subunit SecE [Bacteroidales bacterium]|jgi:preprotein translocase subunit SecE|nr:preprotein translocase subunit SecE [Bacteroidales bacterium]
MSKIINYCKESYTELTKKVSWPSWGELQHAAIVVMIASLIIAIIIYVMDVSFREIMTSIYKFLY